MKNANLPNVGDLPTLHQLNRATALAFGVAVALLATTILPAEYGVDPIGTGRLLGLTRMGEVKQAEHAAETATVPAATTTAPSAATSNVPATAQSAEVKVTLAPDEGREVKADMRAGDKITYAWTTGGPEIRFELHGEEHDAPADEYTSYEKGSSAGERGEFQAPFDGMHGWYWRNRTSSPVTVTVTATGTFRSFAAKPKS
ncbi:hypothetical protein ACXY7D_15245 [Sphingomonas melonis]|uniref:Transmembrane anchor protein n=1 Tax=Sphingomonas turrisvirgatae TaxID=1888892 RepID=A0A1E3LZB8_9SPHN|nr:hypothetical protein [Sphingomonas turrisvirgatae]ODP39146.1 hypothetical protein BFL28_11320 [Sphingomonas turrisvirgatae]